MQKNTTQNTKQSGAGAMLGLAAIAAAGYFIFGPNGKNNRKQIKGWTLKMKGEVLERLEKLKDVTPEVYNGIIDDVSQKYGKMKDINAVQLAEVVRDLRKHWKAIDRDMKARGAARTVSSAKKAPAKKSAPKKRASKKAVPQHKPAEEETGK